MHTLLALLAPAVTAAPPTLVGPMDGAAVATAPRLEVTADVPVRFYGRLLPSAPAADFQLVVLPDTQYYSCGCEGGEPETFYAQTAYTVAKSPAFVAHLGDCVEHGDEVPAEWEVVETALGALEDPVTTGLPEGIPYGIAVGNHDQTPTGDPLGSTVEFNARFGVARFAGRSYYGGSWDADNDDSFALFESGGVKFVVIFLAYDPDADPARVAWARDVAASHPDRHAVVVTHHALDNDGELSKQGAAIQDALGPVPSYLMTLAGHIPGEAHRTDIVDGRPVHTVLSDYQGRDNGGDGWLRVMTFSPSKAAIYTDTWSPTLKQGEHDADSRFTLDAPVDAGPWVLLGEAAPVDGVASFDWTAAATPGTWQWRVVGEQGGAAGPWTVVVTEGTAPVDTGDGAAPDEPGEPGDPAHPGGSPPDAADGRGAAAGEDGGCGCVHQDTASVLATLVGALGAAAARRRAPRRRAARDLL